MYWQVESFVEGIRNHVDLLATVHVSQVGEFFRG